MKLIAIIAFSALLVAPCSTEDILTSITADEINHTDFLSNESTSILESDPVYWYYRGLNLSKSSKSYNESIEAFDKAIELNQSFESAWYKKGLVLWWQGKPDDALKAFDKVIELNESSIKAWELKAHCLSDIGVILSDPNKFDDCINAYNKVIELDPENDIAKSNIDGAWFNKGLILKEFGRNSEAKAAFANVDWMPMWMKFTTQQRGQGFEGLLILYDDKDESVRGIGKLRIEVYEDREYKNKLWIESFDVDDSDFNFYKWGFGREATGWKLNRISFDEIQNGAEDPSWYVRAYFDSPDGSTLRDTAII